MFLFHFPASSLAAQSCFNLLEPVDTRLPKRSFDLPISSGATISNTIRHHKRSLNLEQATPTPEHKKSFPNLLESGPSNDTSIGSRVGSRITGEKYWSKSRLLQPAKSTPSLLHIDETGLNESAAMQQPFYDARDCPENNESLSSSNFQGIV